MSQPQFESETVPQPSPQAAASRRVRHEHNQHASDQSHVSASSSSKPPINNQPDSGHMKTKSSSSKQNFVIALLMVVAGIGTGYAVYKATASNQAASASIANPTTPESAEHVTVGEVYGAEKGETFTDEAEGVLVKGGVKGEGSHHILREGGPSRNVYLTSSVLDLNLFNDNKVKVWGETFQAQEAGWLMDVGRVEVVELNAEKPFEEDSE